MRLSPEKLEEITRLSQPAAQVRWFKRTLGADVPRDATGPIITRAAFEKLVAAKLGLDRETRVSGPARPSIRLTKGVPA